MRLIWNALLQLRRKCFDFLFIKNRISVIDIADLFYQRLFCLNILLLHVSAVNCQYYQTKDNQCCEI